MCDVIFKLEYYLLFCKKMALELSELLCRVCLKQDELMVDIYEYVEEQQTDLCTLLQRCGDIKAERLDKYPKFLCQECTKELLIAAKFRAKCVATEQALRERNGDAEAATVVELVEKELIVIPDERDPERMDGPIEYNPSDNVELYEECETELAEETKLLPVKLLEDKQASAKKYSCDDCGAVFQQAGTLQRHISKAHALVDSYKCHHCDYSFTQLSNLQLHNCEVGESQIPSESATRHRCNYCDKCLQSSSSLAMHLRLHNGERPFACDVCPKTFKTNGGLVTHQKRHLKLLAFECEYCGKGFVETSNLKRHITALHTAERPHSCTICQRSFSRVYLLELHKRTHTGERPYACSMCDRSFAQLSVLRTHELIHSGERRLRCEVCHKTFSRSMQLKKHQLKPCQPINSDIIIIQPEQVSS